MELLFCWHDQKGRPQPLAIIITILLFACLPATWASLCKFFFLSFAQTDSPFSCLGKSQQENVHEIDEEEKAVTFGLFFAYSQTFFSFLLEGVVVIYVVLVNISYIYRVLTFNIFYRSLYSTANSASSQPLVFPYFTQPRENSLTYFSVENLARTSLGRNKKRRYSYPNFSWFHIFLVLVLLHSLCYLIFDCRPLKK